MARDCELVEAHDGHDGELVVADGEFVGADGDSVVARQRLSRRRDALGRLGKERAFRG